VHFPCANQTTSTLVKVRLRYLRRPEAHPAGVTLDLPEVGANGAKRTRPRVPCDQEVNEQYPRLLMSVILLIGLSPWGVRLGV
jgi:hypothetical protein